MVNIRRISPALATALLLLWPLGLQAQEPDFDLKPNLQEFEGSRRRERRDACAQALRRLPCARAGADKIPQADVPSFQAIADRPNQTNETLTTWLLAPHAPMPDPHLARTEIRDLAGYIMSLRKTP